MKASKTEPDSLSTLEHEWSMALKVASDHPFASLTHFIAIMAVQNASTRDTQTTSITEGETDAYRLAKDGQEAQAEKFHAWLKATAPRFSDIQLAKTIMVVLDSLKWSVWLADEDAPDLITSDSPLPPTWGTLEWFGQALANRSRTLEERGVVCFPINRRIVLASTTGPPLERRQLGLTDVTKINSATARHATQLFAAEPDFVWQMENGQIGHANDDLG